MNNYMSLTIIIQLSFYATTLAFVFQQKHLLMSLLCLEGMMLTLVLLIPMFMYDTQLMFPTLSIIMLTLGACEASLGLSMMVYMSRSYGSDMMNLATINKC